MTGSNKKTRFEILRRDGRWQELCRETYDRGNGAVLLLFNARLATVVLTRQCRFPAFLNGCANGVLIEACAGLLDRDDAETCIRREAEEETGFRIRSPRKLFEAYMSPGSVTEKLYFSAAAYEASDRIGLAGGAAQEGEGIEVIELPLADALLMIKEGLIEDGKTIMLLQHDGLAGAGEAGSLGRRNIASRVKGWLIAASSWFESRRRSSPGKLVGHGLALLMAPTSVVLVGGLAIAKVAYDLHLRFVWPLLLDLFVVSTLIIGLATTLA